MTLDTYFDAAVRGDLPSIKRLVGTMAGMTNTEHQSALMRAAQLNHKEVVKFLARYEHNIADAEGLKAINYAKTSGSVDCYNILREYEVMEDRNQTEKLQQQKRELLIRLRKDNDRREKELTFKMCVFRLLFYSIVFIGSVFVFTSFLE